MARGPAYPFVNLEEAVEFAGKMYKYARRSPAQPESIIREAWNYSPTSSGSQKTLAAVKYFGLIEDVPNSDARAIRITDRAYRILIDDPASAERKQALQDAALSPKAYAMCWNRWGSDMPPSMRSTLLFEEGFVESTVDSFLADYKKSIEFAGLLQAHEDFSAPQIVVSETTAAVGGTSIVPNAISSPSVPTVDDSMRSDVFSLTEGNVTLIWPYRLSPDSFEDLSAWLDLIKKKIGRAVKSENTAWD